MRFPMVQSGRQSQAGFHESASAAGLRSIEVHQNWLARLFRVKPAMRYLCFNISRKRTRQEIAILMREWRKYGMKDVQVDKERNIVFARVGQKNCKCQVATSHPNSMYANLCVK
jgi:serine/threonine-protein kinase HSL1, negative regulator of Swe1 kinase